MDFRTRATAQPILPTRRPLLQIRFATNSAGQVISTLTSASRRRLGFPNGRALGSPLVQDSLTSSITRTSRSRTQTWTAVSSDKSHRLLVNRQPFMAPVWVQTRHQG